MPKTEDERQKDLQHVLGVIRSIRHFHLDKILVVAEALNRWKGCTTPAEEFLGNVVGSLAHGLTPDDVRHALNEFEENFAALQAETEYAHRFYPELAETAAKAARDAS